MAKQRTRKVIKVLKTLVGKISLLSPGDLSTQGASWVISSRLAGPAFPRHGYTMCHGIQLATAMGLFNNKPENWVPEGYGSNTCKAISYITGEGVRHLSLSPALVCLRLTMLRRAAAKIFGSESFPALTNNDLKIQLCQWMKDSLACKVVTIGVFRKALTSKRAAKCGDEYINKRKLDTLVLLAVNEASANKRCRNWI